MRRCSCGRPAIVMRGEGRKARAITMDDHALCSRCYRSERQRHYARLRKEHPSRPREESGE